MISLSKFQITPTNGEITLTCDLDLDGDRQQIYYQITCPENKQDQITVNAACFVVGMVIPAMERGLDIHIDGALDATLLHKLNYFVVPFLLAYNKALKPIVITCAQTTEPDDGYVAKGALTGMSCGVDSLETLSRYTQDDLPERYKIRSIAVYDVGAFDDTTAEDTKTRKLFTIDKASYVARESGCDFYVVSSNISSFYKTNFQKSVSLLNVSCAYALADICDTYLCSSSAAYTMVSMTERKLRAIDNLDAILLPLLGSPRLEVISSGAGTNRFRKVMHIVENSKFLDQIEICTRPQQKKNSAKNCGSCLKCSQFLMIAEQQGKLAHFEDMFDLAEYHRRRVRVVQRTITIAKQDHIASATKDVFAFLKEGDFKMPLAAVVAGTALAWFRRIKNMRI